MPCPFEGFKRPCEVRRDPFDRRAVRWWSVETDIKVEMAEATERSRIVSAVHSLVSECCPASMGKSLKPGGVYHLKL